METIELTPGGPRVSALGFGCNNFGHTPYGNFVEYEPCERVVHAALDLGYTFFDTADVYGQGDSEEYLGRALGRRRPDVLVATKFGAPMKVPGAPEASPGSREYVRWAAESSLRRLGTDYIDLLQIHRPDPDTPIAETLSALGELVGEGKVRYVGVGGFSVEQLDAAAEAATAGDLPYPVSSMSYYSLLSRGFEADVIPACERLGIRIHPWFALESGLLTGKYRRGAPGPEGARYTPLAERVRPEAWDAIEAVSAYAEKRGVSMIQLAIGGIAAMPGVGVVVVGASTPEQAAANAAARDWTPSGEELEEIRSLPWATPLG